MKHYNLDYIENMRFNMIDKQIRHCNISDKQVLSALFKIKRENFVPLDKYLMAFYDLEIPLIINGIDTNEKMLSPKIEAFLIQSLKLRKEDSVLEIGSGSGYQSAIMSYIANNVTTIEINKTLFNFAKFNINNYNIKNVVIKNFNAFCLPKYNFYNAILITGSLPIIPKKIKEYLKIGGRMVLTVGKSTIMNIIRVTRKSKYHFITEILLNTNIMPLKNIRVNQIDTKLLDV